jgi:hypothetical protein
MQKAWKAATLVMAGGLIAGPVCAGVTLLPEKPAAVEYDPKTGFPDHNGAFSAMMIVIPQAQLSEFEKADGGNRQISRVSRAETGAQLAIKLVFTGLSADAAGKGEVTYDLKVLSPDGQVYGASDYSHLAALRGPIGDGKRVFDNRTKVVLMSFDPQDKPGIYTIKAVVRDEVARLEVPLVATVEFAAPTVAAVAPEKATAPKATSSKKKSRHKRSRR